MATTRQAITIAGVTLLTAGIGYCFYFDYKRRNDPVFRKKLRKQVSVVRANRSHADEAPERESRKIANASKASATRDAVQATEMLQAAVDAVNAEPLPQTVEAKENYFMEQVGMGEMLAQRLPQGAVPAAIAFYKAYKVYPSPQELIMIYQRTVPDEVFMLVMEMVKIDVSSTLRTAGVGSAHSVPSGDAIIEEIPVSERSQAAAASASPPTSSAAASASTPAAATTSTNNADGPGKSSGSPTQSTAPSENGSLSATGRSYVMVNEEAEESGSLRPGVASLDGSVAGNSPPTSSVPAPEEKQEDKEDPTPAEVVAVAAEAAASVDEVPEVSPEVESAPETESASNAAPTLVVPEATLEEPSSS